MTASNLSIIVSDSDWEDIRVAVEREGKKRMNDVELGPSERTTVCQRVKRSFSVLLP